MKGPLVSVVMAVKNGERFIAQAIESVLAQDYDPLEIVVVDGQSVDRTAQIVGSYARIRLIRQQDTGVTAAYNHGIASASGEFVAFLSHDDLWTTDKLQIQISYMLDNPSVQYTTAHVRFFLEPGMDKPPGMRPELLQGAHPARIVETLVARRSLFAEIGDFDPGLSAADDVDWYARAQDFGIETTALPQVLLSKRVHDANLSFVGAENNQYLLTALRRSIARKKSRGHSGS